MVVISSSFSAPALGVLFQTPGTQLRVNGQEMGTATLYVTENNVIWGGGVLPSGTAAPTITLAYPNISLHAIQKDPIPAIYMMLSYELRIPQVLGAVGEAPVENDEDDDDDDNFEPDHTPSTQLWFYPQTESDVEELYQALSQGQSLHPDPEDEPYMDGEDVDDAMMDEGDEEEFEDAEESDPMPEEAAARLLRLRIQNANGAPASHHEENGVDEAIEE